MATELKNLSSYDPTKVANGKGRRVGIVYAEWNDEITYALRDGAVKTLLDNGVEEIDITLARRREFQVLQRGGVSRQG